MFPSGKYKKVPIKPFTGVLDVRSAASDMGDSTIRWRENWTFGKDGRMKRRGGFGRFLPANPYNNADLHDQMLPAQRYYGELTPPNATSDQVVKWPDPSNRCLLDLKTRTFGRELVTMLFQVVATWGERRLLVGTQSRLYELNQVNGTYRMLCDGYGGSTRDDLSVRWHAAQVDDIIIFTNGIDRPISYLLDDPHQGCNIRATREIAQLGKVNISTKKTASFALNENLGGINLERAGTVVSYNGVVLFGDITMDNTRFPNRILWSSYKKPLTYDPSKDSFCGFQDLPNGHKILRFEPISGYLLCYTSIGIYNVQPTGDGKNPFSFAPIYESISGDRCLAYPNALASDGTSHYFMGEEGIYTVDVYNPTPVLVDWLHQGTGEIYRDINAEACHAHCAGYDTLTGEFWFSWARNGQKIPRASFVFYPKNKFADYVDTGFICYCNFQPDPRYNFRDLMLSLCACMPNDVSAIFTKEGLPKAVTCSSVQPKSIWTSTVKVVDGLNTEDVDAMAHADADSLCAALAGKTASDFCSECAQKALFIAVSAEDLCIKQLNEGTLSREVCINSPGGIGYLDGSFAYHSFDGFYVPFGYYSMLRPCPLSFGSPNDAKNVSFLQLDMDADANPVVPAHVSFRVGSSFSPLDPNPRAGCDIQWSNFTNRRLRCPQKLSAGQYAERGLAPSVGIESAFYITGNYIYVELAVGTLSDLNNENSVLLPGIGGDCSISGMNIAVRKT